MSEVIYKTIDRLTGYRFGGDGSMWTSWKMCGGRKMFALSEEWRLMKPYMYRGYYQVRLKDRCVFLHKLILEAFAGPPQKGQVTRHLDGNGLNNIPENLCWGTHAENAADKKLHGTDFIGIRNPAAKLNERDVLKIRKLRSLGWNYIKIAKKFGVTNVSICNICLRKTWRHL